MQGNIERTTTAEPGATGDALTEYVAIIEGLAGSAIGEKDGYAPRGYSLRTPGDDFWRVVQEFIDALPLLVLVVDETHSIAAYNRALQRYLGKADHELRGGYCPKVVHGLEEPFAGCPLEESLKLGRWVQRELFDSPSGKWVASAIYPTPWRTEKGHRLFIHVVEDITVRKNAEEKLRQALDGTIGVLAAAIEVRDPYTADHARRVALLARAIAAEAGFTVEQAEATYVAALVHDIGKLYVPVELLNKPRRLTEVEMNLVKMHPRVACEILEQVAFPWPIAEIVLQHHERMDGSGYPDGLVGADILPEARALAVADVVEAISSHRPYRAALGTEAALAEIARNKGSLYDPVMVDACLRVFDNGFHFPRKTDPAT